MIDQSEEVENISEPTAPTVIASSPNPDSSRHAVTGRFGEEGLSWLARLAALGAFSIAGVAGWSSGTVVERAMSGFFLTDPALRTPVVSSETPVDVRAVRSNATDTISPGPNPEAGPPSTPVDSGTAPPEAEDLRSKSESATAQPGLLEETQSSTPVAARFGTTVQVGAFRNRANAERLAEVLRGKHGQVHMSLLPNDVYAVRMGPFLEKQMADRIAREIQAEMDLSPLVLRARLE